MRSRKIRVFVYLGENDEYRWHEEMKRETLAGLHASRLFDGFEEARQGCSS